MTDSTPEKSPAPTLVLLAAGMGSRYGGLKQMAPMGPNGETLLDYSVFDALRAGFGKIVFIIRRDFEEAFKSTVVDRFSRQVAVELAFQDADDLPERAVATGFQRPAERQKPWGTGHATLAARHVVKEPFCVINADDFYGLESFQTVAGFLNGLPAGPAPGAPIDSAMVGFVMKNTLSEHGKVARGVCETSPDGLWLDRVEELTDLYRAGTAAENRPAGGPVRPFTGGELVSMNFWGFTPAIFPAFEEVFADFLLRDGQNPKAEFYIPVALDQLIRAGRARCRMLRSTASWFGVTYQEDAPVVRQSLLKWHAAGVYPGRLWG